jgi:hypothetical protein
MYISEEQPIYNHEEMVRLKDHPVGITVDGIRTQRDSPKVLEMRGYDNRFRLLLGLRPCKEADIQQPDKMSRANGVCSGHVKSVLQASYVNISVRND